MSSTLVSISNRWKSASEPLTAFVKRLSFLVFSSMLCISGSSLSVVLIPARNIPPGIVSHFKFQLRLGFPRETLGPLHGAPVAFKDLASTQGDRTTLGSKIFEHNVADYDPVIVQRAKAAGAIIVGKTNTPEFAHAGFTHSPLWGITRNPFLELF